MAALGVVVVGLGMAGKVRCRDIGLSAEYVCAFPELEGVQLKGFCSRRDCSLEGVTKLSFEDALSRSDVHCVVICTETAAHEDMTKKALEAKKHVLVEFPMAMTFQGAKEMFDLAHSKGVVLHEENILLQTDQMKNVLATSKEKTVKKAKMALSAKLHQWHIAEGAPMFNARVPYLHCLLLACGPLTPVSASVTLTEVAEGQHKVEAKGVLRSKDKVDVEMQANYGKDTSWTSAYEYEFADGTILTNPCERPKPPVPPIPGLFMRDFISFIGVVRGSAKTYLPEDISLEALRLADELQKMASKAS